MPLLHYTKDYVRQSRIRREVDRQARWDANKPKREINKKGNRGEEVQEQVPKKLSKRRSGVACRAAYHLSRAAQKVDLVVNSVDAALVDKPVTGRRAAVGILQVHLGELVGEPR
jgi:hypothetical protein